MVFILLLIVLVFFVTACISFFVQIRRMNVETFRRLCSKKVISISKRHKFCYLNDVNLTSYESNKLSVNHVIFGKKFIYLISDFLLKGFISGEEKDNSWIYFDNVKKTTHYLSNLHAISDQNIRDFAEILQISPDPIVSICLVPNICDFKVKSDNSDKKLIVHYASLSRIIRKYERRHIGELDIEQVMDEFNTIKAKNNEESR